MNTAAEKKGKSLIILGIDPGTRITGYGIIKSEQSVSTPLDFGCIRPPPHLPAAERYLAIFNAIEQLMDRRGAFDYILLETTGLADPGNVAPIFWVDDGLGSTVYLDGIVTVVDAHNIIKSLEEPIGEEKVDDRENAEGGHHAPGAAMTVAHLQISHADIIILNKIDLVSPPVLESVASRIHSINGIAEIINTTHARVPDLSGTLLDLHAYDSVQFSRALTENVVFAQHNLAMDRGFNEFNVIVCRNVMIYFDRALQSQVHDLFYDSLGMFGILALGHKESIAFTSYADRYEEVDAEERLYRKIA